MTRPIVLASPKHLVCVSALVGVLGTLLAGCPATGIGDPCTPEQEYNSTFNGFDIKEVSAESKSLQCQTRVCLVHHFQGRVSCPYGQTSNGGGPGGGAGCSIPGTSDPVTGDPNLPATSQKVVNPQCIDRRAANSVYCSCRCANADGKTDDGANYCKCSDGFTCAQVYPPTGLGNEGLTGAYCIKTGTDYNAAAANCVNTCNQGTKNCEAD